MSLLIQFFFSGNGISEDTLTYDGDALTYDNEDLTY